MSERAVARGLVGDWCGRLGTVLVMLLALIVTACGTGRTPAGPVGDVVDVRPYLPAAVSPKAPSDADATQHEAVIDLHGTPIKIVWRTFEVDGAKFILSYQWELPQEREGFRLVPRGHDEPEGVTASPGSVEKLSLRIGFQDVSWVIAKVNGWSTVKISADGVGGVL